MKNKLKIIIPIAIAVIAIIIAAFTIRFNGGDSVDIRSMMSTAQKYLVENNYEQAIMEYEAIINLEPNSAEAYLGIAKAYVGMGDTGKAIEWLKKGYELTGDERLKDMLDGLTAANISNDELVQVLMQLIEDPNADIEQEKLDAIYEVSIFGSDFYAVNESAWEKYHFNSIIVVYDNNGEYVKNRYIVDNGNTQIEYKGGMISDLNFLERLSNLNSVTISYNQISDISALSGLTRLTYLGLFNNEISDISALSGMTELISLNLNQNQISDISALSGMTELISLDLGYNQISDIKALNRMTNLNELYLYGNQISDISVLRTCSESS